MYVHAGNPVDLEKKELLCQYFIMCLIIFLMFFIIVFFWEIFFLWGLFLDHWQTFFIFFKTSDEKKTIAITLYLYIFFLFICCCAGYINLVPLQIDKYGEWPLLWNFGKNYQDARDTYTALVKNIWFVCPTLSSFPGACVDRNYPSFFYLIMSEKWTDSNNVTWSRLEMRKQLSVRISEIHTFTGKPVKSKDPHFTNRFLGTAYRLSDPIPMVTANPYNMADTVFLKHKSREYIEQRYSLLISQQKGDEYRVSFLKKYIINILDVEEKYAKKLFHNKKSISYTLQINNKSVFLRDYLADETKAVRFNRPPKNAVMSEIIIFPDDVFEHLYLNYTRKPQLNFSFFPIYNFLLSFSPRYETTPRGEEIDLGGRVISLGFVSRGPGMNQDDAFFRQNFKIFTYLRWWFHTQFEEQLNALYSYYDFHKILEKQKKEHFFYKNVAISLQQKIKKLDTDSLIDYRPVVREKKIHIRTEQELTEADIASEKLIENFDYFVKKDPVLLQEKKTYYKIPEPFDTENIKAFAKFVWAKRLEYNLVVRGELYPIGGFANPTKQYDGQIMFHNHMPKNKVRGANPLLEVFFNRFRKPEDRVHVDEIEYMFFNSSICPMCHKIWYNPEQDVSFDRLVYKLNKHFKMIYKQNYPIKLERDGIPRVERPAEEGNENVEYCLHKRGWGRKSRKYMWSWHKNHCTHHNTNLTFGGILDGYMQPYYYNRMYNKDFINGQIFGAIPYDDKLDNIQQFKFEKAEPLNFVWKFFYSFLPEEPVLEDQRELPLIFLYGFWAEDLINEGYYFDVHHHSHNYFDTKKEIIKERWVNSYRNRYVDAFANCINPPELDDPTSVIASCGNSYFFPKHLWRFPPSVSVVDDFINGMEREDWEALRASRYTYHTDITGWQWWGSYRRMTNMNILVRTS